MDMDIAAIAVAIAVTHLTAKPTSNVEATFDSVNPRA